MIIILIVILTLILILILLVLLILILMTIPPDNCWDCQNALFSKHHLWISSPDSYWRNWGALTSHAFCKKGNSFVSTRVEQLQPVSSISRCSWPFDACSVRFPKSSYRFFVNWKSHLNIKRAEPISIQLDLWFRSRCHRDDGQVSPGRRPQANKASSWIREAQRERWVVDLKVKQQRYSLSMDDGLNLWHIQDIRSLASFWGVLPCPGVWHWSCRHCHWNSAACRESKWLIPSWPVYHNSSPFSKATAYTGCELYNLAGPFHSNLSWPELAMKLIWATRICVSRALSFHPTLHQNTSDCMQQCRKSGFSSGAQLPELPCTNQLKLKTTGSDDLP